MVVDPIVSTYFGDGSKDLLEQVARESNMTVLSQYIEHINKYRDYTFLERVMQDIRASHFTDFPNVTPTRYIRKRIENFFETHKTATRWDQSIGYIKFQKLIVSYCRRGYLKDMVGNHVTNARPSTTTRPPTAVGGPSWKRRGRNRRKHAKDIAAGFLSGTNIAEAMMTATTALEDPSCVDELFKLTAKVKRVVEGIVASTLQNNTVNKRDYTVAAYGSYTSHLIDRSVEYADIDIYHTHSYIFLNMVMFVFFILTELNDNIDFYNIPFVPFLTPLRFRNENLLDCIYIDPYILRNMIHTVTVSGVRIVHPLHQMLNNVRMASECDRAKKLEESRERYIHAWDTLITWLGPSYLPSAPIDMATFISKFKVSENRNIVALDLDTFITARPATTPRNFIFVLADEPAKFVRLMERAAKDCQNVKISNYTFAFFNEIFFEVGTTIAAGARPEDLMEPIEPAANYNDLHIPSDCVLGTSHSLTVYFGKGGIRRRSAVALLASAAQYLYLHGHQSAVDQLTPLIFAAMCESKENIEDSFFVKRYKVRGRAQHTRMCLAAGEYRTIGRGRGDDISVPRSPYLVDVKGFADMVYKFDFSWLQ